MTLTEKQVEAIRERARAATPGPWRWNSYSTIFANVPKGHPLDYSDPHDTEEDGWTLVAGIDGGPSQRGHGDELRVPQARADAVFIEHSREDIVALLTDRDALLALLRDIVYGPHMRGVSMHRCPICKEHVINASDHAPECPFTQALVRLNTRE